MFIETKQTKTRMLQVGVNKSVLKEYHDANNERRVFMKDGEEFQLNLFNDKSSVISAVIYINGKQINNRLILNPGERVWLERYLDKHTRFKFSTYEVEDNNDVVDKAIAHNGLIEVQFYYEKVQQHCPSIAISSPDIIYYNNDNNISLAAHDNNLLFSTNCASLSSNICSNDSILNLNNISTTTNSCFYTNKTEETATTTKETGRIGEGSYSNQEFETTYKTWETWPFATEKIQILPNSRKPITTTEAQKCYCSQCGRKLKSKYRFCPYCGEEIE